MRISIGWFLCAVVMVMVMVMVVPSAEARLLLFNWDVKEELDPKNMKVLTINGKTPCPNIHAQQGDVIDVTVTNNLQEEIAIRWQKIKQIGTPPCNETNGFILAGGTCAYRLVANQTGEFSYRSEFKMQGDAGLSGSITVLPRVKKQVKKNPQNNA